MGHHEKIWLENFQGSEMLFYRRYVYDTFCLFHSEHDAIIFFDYINSRHPNIKFTMEKEALHKLPFLDVLVDNNDPSSFLTRVYLYWFINELFQFHFVLLQSGSHQDSY